MKIALRLTLVFSVMVASILLIFAIGIYLTSKQDREDEFYDRLRIKTITRAELFINAKVHPSLIQSIHQENKKIMNEAQVVIYDLSGHLLYHDDIHNDIIHNAYKMFADIRRKKEIHGYVGEWQTISLLYTFEGRHYMITGAAYDYYGYNKIDSMFEKIVLFYTIAILFIVLAGYLFSRNALTPVKDIINKVNTISASSLNSRLMIGKSKDELNELSLTFNAMLNRVDSSFESQKNFVSNISHELRTPLATMAAELELTLQRDRQPEEYKSALLNILNDTKQLIRLSSTLLDFAKASYDASKISFTTLRVDEIIMEARLQVIKLNPEYNIDILFENDFDTDEQISLRANTYLLKVAFMNLIENGCKYSLEKSCKVSIFLGMESICLTFIDQGSGIPASHYEKIFTPFFRGDNQHMASGSGIGLALTKKIISLHHGTINVKSETETIFIVTLPNLSA